MDSGAGREESRPAQFRLERRLEALNIPGGFSAIARSRVQNHRRRFRHGWKPAQAQVHIAPGHGKDDYIAGTGERNCPSSRPWMTSANSPRTSACPRGSASMSSMPTPRSSLSSVRAARCSRSRNTRTTTRTAGAARRPSSSARWSSFSSALMPFAPRRSRPWTSVNVAPAMGSQPHLRHRRIAARLVHLAPAHVGRAAAGFLRGEWDAHRAHPDLAALQVADLVENGGTNLWFEKDDAWWAAQLGLPAGTSRRNDTLDVWIDSGVSHHRRDLKTRTRS